MADIKGYTLAQIELWVSAADKQRRQAERSMATAARYAQANSQAFGQYMKRLNDGR